MHWPIIILLSGTLQHFNITWKNFEFHHWNNYKLTFNKSYESTDEEVLRKDIYYKNVRKINAHNKRFSDGLETFEMGVNDFTDMTTEEFEQKYLMTNVPMTTNETSVMNENMEAVSRILWFKHELNWYREDIPVRDQGECNSCWAFAATALIEYEYFTRKKKFFDLSAQELLDCTYKKYGCAGGWTELALNYVKKHGIHFEQDYPYDSLSPQKSKFCKGKHLRAPCAHMKVKKVGKVERKEKEIYEELRSHPLKIAVYANPEAFKNYKRGFVTPEDCLTGNVNHAVVLLGAIKEEDGTPVWFLRNSWGPNWGINGHFKLLMGNNTCNILDREALYIKIKTHAFMF